MISPYPLLFEPILLEKVWGGRRLERLGKRLPPGKLVGESWELADLAATSASGAGGQAARSVIANGPLAGKTLHDAMLLWERDLLGEAQPSAAGEFPLLIKFLDARENLSVQVHPSPAYAAAHQGANLKTECWYVLAADPVNGRPPVIYKGTRPGVSRDQFEAHIRNGTVDRDLIAVPAVVGECHTLPSGTCHALGAGVLVAEVQTPSDTTFRVFDWGRSGRELHVKEALACMEFGPAPSGVRLADGSLSGRLVSTDQFQVEEVSLPAGGLVPPADGDGPWVFIVLHGALALESGREGAVVAPVGATALVPARIMATTAAHARPGTRLLVAVPR